MRSTAALDESDLAGCFGFEKSTTRTPSFPRDESLSFVFVLLQTPFSTLFDAGESIDTSTNFPTKETSP